MGFNEDRYTREVLEPARLADGQPPADLVTRYGLSPPLTAAQVAQTLPQVLGCWRRARRELKYRRLVARLESEHARLAPAFDRAVAGDLDQLRTVIEGAAAANRDQDRRLRAEVTDLALPVGRITPELAAELANRHGVPPGQLSTLLEEAGIEVSTADPLPGKPPFSGYPRYRETLRTLGYRHTADFLLHGHRDSSPTPGPMTVWNGVAVAGQPERRLTRSTVVTVDRAWAARPHDSSRTLASTLLVALKALQDSRGPAAISDLVRYEVAEELRARHRQGASAAALVEHAAGSLGLVRDDARRMAFAVRSEPHGAGVPEPEPADVPAADESARHPVAGPGPLSATPPKAPAGAPETASGTPPALPGTPAEAAPGPPRDAVPHHPSPDASPGTPSEADPPADSSPPQSPPRPENPDAAAATAAPPEPPGLAGLAAERVGDEVVVHWQWPAELAEVLLRWRTRYGGDGRWREKAVSRGGYHSQGGAWLALDDLADNPHRNAALEIHLVALTSHHGGAGEDTPAIVVVPGRVEAWYEVARTGPPWRRQLSVAVRAGQPAQLRSLKVVLRKGSVMPLHAADGVVLRQVDDVRLSPESPLRLRLPAPRGPYFLRCFAAGDDTTEDVVELRDPPVVQLRGR